MKKNPFTSSFVWDRDSFGQVTVEVPPIDHTHETTNEQTRNNNPDNRYWKAIISYTFNNYLSDTIRVENVAIPFTDARNYGSTCAYAAFPAWLREAIQKATRARRVTNVDDPTLTSNAEQWWKTINPPVSLNRSTFKAEISQKPSTFNTFSSSHQDKDGKYISSTAIIPERA